MNSDSPRLCGLQLDSVWQNPAQNALRVLQIVTENPPPPGSLLVLPEMYATGFHFDIERHETDGGTPVMTLAALASRFKIFVMGGVTARDAATGKGLNQALVFNPQGEEIVRYTKIHPFSFSGETEKFIGGDEVAVFHWNGFRVAPIICYDLRFPELFRAALERDATLFAVIANWPQARQLHWTCLLQARAIENQAYVIGVNRCGSDPKHQYSGQSRIIAPRGEIVTDAGDRETLFDALPDAENLQNYRREFPALLDRRAGYA